MRGVWVTIGCLFSSLAMAAESAPDSDPFVLHSRALLAEVDGDLGQALSSLRKAISIDASIREIAFDLARVSLAMNSPEFLNDSGALLSFQLTSNDERLLGAHAWLVRGELEKALELATRAGGSDEARALRALLEQTLNARGLALDVGEQAQQLGRTQVEEKPQSQVQARRSESEQPRLAEVAPAQVEDQPSPWGLELSMLGQFDDNPTVAPNDAVAAELGVSAQEGARVAAEFVASYRLGRSESSESGLRLTLGYGAYLSSAESPDGEDAEFGESANDFNGLNAGLSFRQVSAVSRWLFTLDVGANLSTLEETTFYSAAGALNATAVYNLGLVRAGAYANGGFLYFDNQLLSGTSGDDAQRRGPIAASGFLVTGDYSLGTATLFVEGRIGYQLEQLGNNFDESGLDVSLLAGMGWGDVVLSVRSAYSVRDYVEQRSDDLLVVSSDIGWTFSKNLSALGGYLLIQNTSNDAIFEYNRGVAYAGVKAVW